MQQSCGYHQNVFFVFPHDQLELESDPLWTVFDKIVHLLNDLRTKKHIRA
jgi:hypothetical protein